MRLWLVICLKASATLCLACTVYDPSLLEEAEVDETATTVGGMPGADSSDTADTTTSAVSAGGAGGSGTNSSEESGSAESTSSGGSATATVSSAGGAGGSSGDSSAGGSSASGGTSGGESAAGGSAGTGGSPSCSEVDCCADDPDKTEPGACGCGEPDTDSDGDGNADCVDLCPDDAEKLEPGECGCGVPDEDTSEGAGCVELKGGLVHRYSFEGSGSEAVDAVGAAHGAIVGTTLDGSGFLSLVAGGDEQYVELPPGLVSSLESVSVEAWFTWSGGSSWQRLFDFGSTEEGVEGEPGTGYTYLFFTPRASGSGYPRTAFTDMGFASEVYCAGVATLSTEEPHHVVVSLDATNQTLTLYIDGMLQSAKALTVGASSLDDVNSWLGRSQYGVDPQFGGSIDELRIYDIALSRPQVVFSYDFGPDPAFLD